MGYGVDVQLDRDEQPLAVGYLIDDEDCRLSQARNVVQKTFNGVFAAAVVSMTAGSESRSAVSRRSA